MALGEKKSTLYDTARSEVKLLTLYNVSLPSVDVRDILRFQEVDQTAVDILRLYHPAMVKSNVPLSIVGDGNCLYRAVSKSVTGSESYHKLIRLEAALEMIIFSDKYDTKGVNTKRRRKLDFLSDNRIVTSNINSLIHDAVTLGCYSEMAHIYAISASLKTPIRSYYPPQLHPELSSEPFTRTVLGRDVSFSNTDIVIMWSCIMYPANTNVYRPNHFVPLIEKRVSVDESEVVDLTHVQVDDSAVYVTDLVNSPKKKAYSRPSKPSLWEAAYQVNETVDSCDSQNVDEIKTETETSDAQNLTFADSECGFFREEVSNDVNTGTFSESDDSDNSANISLDAVSQTNVETSDAQNLASADSECGFFREEVSNDVSTGTFSESDDSDNSATQDSYASDSDENVTETNHSDNNPAKGYLTSGYFLPLEKLVQLLLKSETCLENIPGGKKENIYYVINNEANIKNRNNRTRSNFSDDCGVWNAASGTTPKSHFWLTESGNLQTIYFYKGRYCRMVRAKAANGKAERKYIPYEPQPEKEQVVILHRYYTQLNADPNYKKRVTWLGEGGLTSVYAVVEYIGTFPGLAAHGNSKMANSEYLRTPAYVMSDVKELLKTNKPKMVFEQLKKSMMK